MVRDFSYDGMLVHRNSVHSVVAMAESVVGYANHLDRVVDSLRVHSGHKGVFIVDEQFHYWLDLPFLYSRHFASMHFI